MRKTVVVTLAVMLSLLVWTPLAAAQSLDKEGLTAVFPDKPVMNQPVTRGAFAAMLVKAANLDTVTDAVYLGPDVDKGSWYAPATATLAARGIVAGYPDGTFKPAQPVTGLEAAVMVARTLGLTGTASTPDIASPLGTGHWGKSIYSWLLDEGLVSAQADPEGQITVEQAATFLAKVFGNDPEALAIVEKSQKASATVKDMSMKGNMAMMTKPRTGVSDKVASVNMKAEMTMEMVLPATLHQVTRAQFEGMPSPGGKETKPTPPIEMEQYMVDGKMYMKFTNPDNGKVEWLRMSELPLPDMESLMKQNLQTNTGSYGIPESLRQYFHYQFLGTTEKNGHKVYELGYYGRIDDMTTFIQQALPEPMRSRLGQQFQRAVQEAGKMFKSISYWGKDYIGIDDNLPRANEIKMVMSFNEQFQGNAIPIELLEMHMQGTELEFNKNLKIELPPEALQAQELPAPVQAPAVTGEISAGK